VITSLTCSTFKAEDEFVAAFSFRSGCRYTGEEECVLCLNAEKSAAGAAALAGAGAWRAKGSPPSEIAPALFFAKKEDIVACLLMTCRIIESSDLSSLIMPCLQLIKQFENETLLLQTAFHTKTLFQIVV
jgi:hypothetical protein